MKLLDPIIFMNVLNQKLVEQLSLQAKMGFNSKFYPSTSIQNLQENKDKIIIGENTHVKGELLLFKHNGKIELGNFTYVGEGSRIWSANQISIGHHVLISHGVQISDTDVHEFNHRDRAKGFEQIILRGHSPHVGSVNSAPIVIDDYVWINFNVCILKGVTIGKGAIVAAGSVVVRDVKPFTLVAGNPAREIKTLSHD